MKIIGVLTLFFLLTVNIVNATEIPRTIGYQGFLKENDSNVDTVLDMTFELFTASTGGSSIWTETRTGANQVTVTDGFFSVSLGEVTVIPDSVDFSEKYYLEVTISGTTLSPRQSLESVPYARIALGTEVRSSAPSTTIDGSLYFDPTGNGSLYVYDTEGGWSVLSTGTTPSIDSAYNAFGATASKITVDASESQTGGLEFETANTQNLIFDIGGTGNIQIQDGGTAFVTFSDGGLTTFTDGVTINGTTTLTGLTSVTSGFRINSETFTDLTGSGLVNTAGVLTIDLSSIDHGTLSGLLDDDHTQYALLSGRSGGQTIIGGTASGEDLVLQSTSNATRGSILFGSAGNSAYDEVNDRLGIGTATPENELVVFGSDTQTDVQIKTNVDLGSGNTTQLSFISDDNGTPNSASLGQFQDGALRFSGSANLVTPDLTIADSGNIGIGTTSPSQALTVSGNVYITGALYDNANSPGTAGYILQSDGSGIDWVATSTLGIGGGGDALTTNPLSQFASTLSSQLAGVISDETGSGSLVFATSPTLVTPTLGVATATTVNKVTITAPATSATLTLAQGSSLITSGANSLTLTSTGVTNVTLPTTGTLATRAGTETLTNKTIAFSSNTLTNVMSLTTAQSVTAGIKKTFQSDATNAGLRFAGVTANPSTLVAGDIWYRSDTEKLTFRGASGARSLVSEDLAQTLTNKTISGASNTISNINLASQVIGNLPVTNLNSGTSASASTYWRGDGTWAAVAAGGVSIGDSVGSGTAGSTLFVDASGNLGQDNASFYWDTTTDRLLLEQATTNALIIYSGDPQQTGTYGTDAIDIQTTAATGDIASGSQSIAIGTDNEATSASAIAIGDGNTSSNTKALTLGASNIASGAIFSMSVGALNEVSGQWSTAIGYDNDAIVDARVLAVGYLNDALGADSTAVGRTNSTAGGQSTAVGYINDSTGTRSSTFGYSNVASGLNSVSLGYDNTASASGAIALGASITNATSNSLMIGPSNTAKLTILSTGNTGIGTTTPAQMLHVVRSDAGAPVRFQDSDGYCEIDPTTTTWSCTSDRRLKENIHSFSSSNSLSQINKLNPVTFEWISDKTNSERTGLIAQEVEKVIPSLVRTDNQTGLKSVAYGGFVPYMLSAIQELSIKIDNLTAQIGTRFTNVTNAIFDKLTVGSSEKPTGITLFDQETGKPYCLNIKNGQISTNIGKCGSVLLQDNTTLSNTIINETPVDISDPDQNNNDVIDTTNTPVVSEDEILTDEENSLDELGSTEGNTDNSLNDTVSDDTISSDDIIQEQENPEPIEPDSSEPVTIEPDPTETNSDPPTETSATSNKPTEL